mmetsp:Transcript_7997/g.11874  ORF Transcript_7997/g.11874 Transcript_7997/m.11874 type:complete len:309 (+) Transcript_7997:219-1145(+)
MHSFIHEIFTHYTTQIATKTYTYIYLVTLLNATHIPLPFSSSLAQHHNAMQCCNILLLRRRRSSTSSIGIWSSHRRRPRSIILSSSLFPIIRDIPPEIIVISGRIRWCSSWSWSWSSRRRGRGSRRWSWSTTALLLCSCLCCIIRCPLCTVVFLLRGSTAAAITGTSIGLMIYSSSLLLMMMLLLSISSPTTIAPPIMTIMASTTTVATGVVVTSKMSPLHDKVTALLHDNPLNHALHLLTALSGTINGNQSIDVSRGTLLWDLNATPRFILHLLDHTAPPSNHHTHVLVRDLHLQGHLVAVHAAGIG